AAMTCLGDAAFGASAAGASVNAAGGAAFTAFTRAGFLGGAVFFSIAGTVSTAACSVADADFSAGVAGFSATGANFSAAGASCFANGGLFFGCRGTFSGGVS